MEMYDSDKLNNRLQELNAEELSLKKSLMENSNSTSINNIEKTENSLVGVKAEKEQIKNMLYGGFYWVIY